MSLKADLDALKKKKISYLCRELTPDFSGASHVTCFLCLLHPWISTTRNFCYLVVEVKGHNFMSHPPTVGHWKNNLCVTQHVRVDNTCDVQTVSWFIQNSSLFLSVTLSLVWMHFDFFRYWETMEAPLTLKQSVYKLQAGLWLRRYVLYNILQYPLRSCLLTYLWFI